MTTLRKRLFTIREVSTFPPYTPFVGWARDDALQVIFQQSPNGLWWLNGYEKPQELSYILNLCSNGVLPLEVPPSEDDGSWSLQ